MAADPQHENVFRALNERIRVLVTTFRVFDDGTIPFVCECSAETCFVPVEMAMLDYDEICATEGSVLAPGHTAGVAVAG
jgi:hypothetical protein